jgi:hypothetical protein
MEHDYMAKVEHMDRGKYMNMKEDPSSQRTLCRNCEDKVILTTE